MWSDLGLFATPPRSVLDVYSKTAQSLANLRQQHIANALSQIKLNYAPQMAQQAADLGKANVSIKQSDAQYEPSMNAADLMIKHLSAQGQQLTNAMNSEKFKYLPQQIQQGIAFKNSQIDLMKAKIKGIDTTASAEKRRQGALYQFNQTLKTVPAAERPAYIAQHSPQLEQILNTNLDEANQQNPGAQSSAPQSSQQPTPTPFNPMGNMSGISQSQSQNSPSPTIAMPQNSAPTPGVSSSAQGAPSALENQSKFMANEKAAGPKATARLNSAIELEKIMSDPKFDEIAKSATKYAGIGGKIKGGLDAWLNSNPKEYNDFLQFKNQYGSMITNILRQVEGLGVQESTREEIKGNLMQSIDQLSSNPERALEQYKRFTSQLRSLAKAASIAAQPTFPGAREKAAGISFEEPMTIKGTRPGYVYVDNGKGQKGYITESEWDNADKEERTQYKRLD